MTTITPRPRRIVSEKPLRAERWGRSGKTKPEHPEKHEIDIFIDFEGEVPDKLIERIDRHVREFIHPLVGYRRIETILDAED